MEESLILCTIDTYDDRKAIYSTASRPSACLAVVDLLDACLLITWCSGLLIVRQIVHMSAQQL